MTGTDDESGRVLFLVNTVEEVTTEQSTAGLVAAMSGRRGTWVTGIRGLRNSPRGLEVCAYQIRPSQGPSDVVRQLREQPQVHPMEAFAAVWVRLNPGRLALAGMVGVVEMLLQAEDAGVVVRNGPAGLLRAASKLFLSSLPADTIPRTWSSRDPTHLRECVAAAGESAVVKPAIGSRGGDVHRLSVDSPGLDELLLRLCQQGPVVVQEYMREAPAGDLRVHLVDGELLENEGRAALVRRVPAKDEWRSNVALGGTPVACRLTPEQGRLVERVGPTLRRYGLWHVGLDVVGDRVVECNVFSPGGLADAGRFEGISFEDLLVKRFDALIRDIAT
ncbi:MAG: hypothetical protein KTR31_29970 [Myxococcales bacterium]|nr:hypothetical protein [Myxococcales bacterium]